MCWKSRFATVLVLPKVFCLFGQQNVVYLLKRQQICTNILNVLKIEIWNSFSFTKRLFAQHKVVYLLKRQQICTNFLNVLKIQIWNSFSFTKSILPFWLTERGLFVQKAVVFYEYPKCARNQDLQKCQFCQKYFTFLASRKWFICSKGSRFVQRS